MLFKNVAGQKLAVYAHDTSADAPKTGDAGNITAQISIDGGATAATNDTNPTELDATDAKGIYIFDLTQAETNGDLIILSAVSSTADVQIEPVIAYTDGVNVTRVSGSSDAADSLEDVYDDTTYTIPNMKTFWENNSGLTTKTVDNVGSTVIRTGTAQAGAAGTITLDASASATDDTYNGSVCIITGGTGVGQCRAIVDYVGSTKVATITPNWTTNPDNTSTFEIQPASSILLHLLGMAAGKLAFSGNVVTVYDWDNSTPLFTNTWDTSGRTRS